MRDAEVQQPVDQSLKIFEFIESSATDQRQRLRFVGCQVIDFLKHLCRNRESWRWIQNDRNSSLVRNLYTTDRWRNRQLQLGQENIRTRYFCSSRLDFFNGQTTAGALNNDDCIFLRIFVDHDGRCRTRDFRVLVYASQAHSFLLIELFRHFSKSI